MTRFAGFSPAPFLAAALALGPAAHADVASSKAVVDAAKAGGQVGEQADGFLGVVSGNSPAVARAVAEINAGRAEAFREAASKTGTSAAAAGAAAGRQLLERTPPGQYIKPEGGGWQVK